MAIILPSNSAAVAAFDITTSLQFDQADSAHLTFTPGSASNQKTFTISVWIKVTADADNRCVVNGGTWPTEPYSTLMFRDDDRTSGDFRISGTSYNYVPAPQVEGSWIHVVMAVDTTQGTQDNRFKLYVDGTQLTSWVYVAKLAINLDTGFNAAHEHQIGEQGGLGRYFNGLMAEFNFIDGTQLAPASFAEDDGGTWTAIEYTGSYGTNGYRLTFSDS